jgi:hypothetical protein
MRFIHATGLCLILLSGCGQREAGSAMETMDVTAAKLDMPMNVADAAAEEPNVPLVGTPTAEPRIAYSYTLGYRLGTGEIGGVQARHIALCDKMGAGKCRIKSMQRESSDGEFVTANLALVVDSKIARPFQGDLDKAVEAAGGESSSRAINAEDLSKQMVDTAARIKAKQALADRLMILLQNRSGKVGELVEAERAFAEAQEELEAARSWMSEMQARVAMSDMTITYASTSPSGSGLWSPIRDAIGEAGQILGESISVMLRFVIGVLPWFAGLAGLIWLVRRLGWAKNWRWPWRRNAPVADLE